MLVANGSPNPADIVWSQGVAVSTNTTYLFSGWGASWGHNAGQDFDPNPPAILVFINGERQDGAIQLIAKNGQWKNFAVIWNSRDSTWAVMETRLATTALSGNDLALDDLAFTAVPTNQPPSVRISSPVNGATFDVGSKITIVANCSDSDGTVARVEFFQGNTKLGEDPPAPFEIVWTNVLTGAYSLTAKATDNLDATATSAPVAIAVVAPPNRPPSISAIAPQHINEDERFTFTIFATDADVPPQILTWSLATDAPLGASIEPTTGQFTWTPTEEQGPTTNVVTVRVTDNGTPPLSATTNFTVIVNEVNLPPALAAIPDQILDPSQRPGPHGHGAAGRVLRRVRFALDGFRRAIRVSLGKSRGGRLRVDGPGHG